MSRNRRNAEPIRIAGLSIIDIAEEGKGVGKADELVIFVDKAVPGDVVDIRVVKKKKNFAEAIIENVQTKSEHRVDPFCSHFGTCGGCKWQHMDYAAQLRFKQKNVEAALQRLAKIETDHMEPILGSEVNKYYRNKLEYTFSNKRWLNADDMQFKAEGREMNALGFHVP
ncbi:MAG: class I SAM-dependent RNA methyltransferase, partial [Pedobacter sp.]